MFVAAKLTFFVSSCTLLPLIVKVSRNGSICAIQSVLIRKQQRPLLKTISLDFRVLLEHPTEGTVNSISIMCVCISLC